MSESDEEVQAAEAASEPKMSSQSLQGIDENVVKAIPITLNVEVGKTKLKLKDLMAVAQGTVLELDRAVGDLMDIKVNNSVIAKGEVVTIGNNKLGIRILEIVSPMDRIRDV
jgi:flagellar motor switch protein FliN/FliY